MDNSDSFKMALQLRDFEISQLTQRNNFFMIFQGVLFAGLVQSGHTKPVVSFFVCATGLLVAIFQIGMGSGAKFWQEYWEQKVSEYEASARADALAAGRPVAVGELFHNNSNLYTSTVRTRISYHSRFPLVDSLILRRFSVSRIPIYVGLALSLIWLLLLLHTIESFSISIVGF